MLKLIVIGIILYVVYRFVTHTPIDTRLVEACSKEETIDDAFRLIESNPNLINMADKDGITPLMAAAIIGNSSLVERLLSKGANVNAVTRRGHTALMCVCMTNKDQHMAELLIKAGAVVNARSKDGLTALGYARHSGGRLGVGLKIYLHSRGAIE